jgi:hypothetical protein
VVLPFGLRKISREEDGVDLHYSIINRTDHESVEDSDEGD